MPMQVELAPSADGRLKAALRTAGRRETGGMLFAEQLEPGHFRVVDFSVDLDSGSHTSFRRNPATHEQELGEFFERTAGEFSRFNYLGEWHSHPSFPIRPSTQDIATMTELVEDGSTINFAVLIIVRLRVHFWMEYSVTVFTRGHPPAAARKSR
jgi:[CysO sulfur-carrier protein]-S-L-cysteine hydrolase